MTASRQPERVQSPGQPTPVGSFNITQLGDTPDKIGKDTNFRGLAIFGNVLYYTKGSGGNGVNTVYFVDTTGKACPSGVGLPEPGAALPASPIAYNPSLLQTEGVYPYNMCILKGFPTALKSATSFPFGLWFANARTLYVADEGNGDNTYSTATGTYTTPPGRPRPGCRSGCQERQLDAGLHPDSGLSLGTPYTVPGYPAGDNAATGLPWGRHRRVAEHHRPGHPDGTATIWAVTSTVSGAGDEGADPTRWSPSPTTSGRRRCPPRASGPSSPPAPVRCCAAFPSPPEPSPRAPAGADRDPPQGRGGPAWPAPRANIACGNNEEEPSPSGSPLWRGYDHHLSPGVAPMK